LQLKKAELVAKTNYDSALLITNSVIETSLKKNDAYHLALAYKLTGYCQYFKSNYPAALENYQHAEKIADENQFKDILLSLYNFQGTFYKKQKLIKESLTEFTKGQAIAEELKD